MIREKIKNASIVMVSAIVFGSSMLPSVALAANNTDTHTTTPSQATTQSANLNTDGAFNIVVSPPTLALQAEPGKPTTIPIKIRNQGLDTEHINVSLMKFAARDKLGTPDLLKFGPNDEFSKWVSFDRNKIDAEPNVWTNINVTISPPKTAAFGYYYAVIFSRDKPASAKKAANLLASVASLLLVDVKAPGAIRSSSIEQFSTPNRVQEFLPLTFNVTMHNKGNVHVAPRGNIYVTKGKKTVAVLEVNQTLGYVLPHSSRQYLTSWQDGTPRYVTQTKNGKVLTDKSGSAIAKLDWSKFGFSKLRMGHYTAHLIMVYNTGTIDESTKAQLSFWVIPWRIIAVCLVVLLLILAGLWAIFGRPIRTRLAKAKGGYAAR